MMGIISVCVLGLYLVVCLPATYVPITSVDMIKPNNDQIINITEGAMIEFQCRTSSGFPPAAISWYKDSPPDVPGGTAEIRDNITSKSVRRGTYQEAITTSILRLYPSRTDNGYSIYCSAKNTPQRIISQRQSIINVLYAPMPSPASTVTTNVTSRLQGFARLYLEISANPNPQASDYVWSKNEDGGWQIIDDSHMIRILTKPQSAKLLFVNVRISDFGEYKLAVQNDIDAPATPTELSYNELNDAPMLQWKSGFDGGLPQTFVIQLRKQSTNYWTEMNITDTQQTHISVRLSSLESDTEYTARVYAFNYAGNSALTQGISFTTVDKGVSSTESVTEHTTSTVVIGTSVCGGVVAIGLNYSGVPSTESMTEHTQSAVVIGAAVGGGFVAIGAIAFFVYSVLRNWTCVKRDTEEKNHRQPLIYLSSENKQEEDEHANGDDHGTIDQTEQYTPECSYYEELGEARTEPSTYVTLHSEQENDDGIYEDTEQAYMITELY